MKNSDWEKIDLDRFREKFPELKMEEIASINAIYNGKQTETMQQIANDPQRGADFLERIKDYKKSMFSAVEHKKAIVGNEGEEALVVAKIKKPKM